jgi:hypothetical protein
MAKNYYRALISIPIFADTDDQAVAQANEHASSLRPHPEGEAIAGHLELLGEVSDHQFTRVVVAEPLSPLPPDWKA